MVAVALDKTVPREMLTTTVHTATFQAALQSQSQIAHLLRIGRETAIADDRTLVPIQIQHRGKRQINATRTQFSRQYPTDFLGLSQSRFFALRLPHTV